MTLLVLSTIVRASTFLKDQRIIITIGGGLVVATYGWWLLQKTEMVKEMNKQTRRTVVAPGMLTEEEIVNVEKIIEEIKTEASVRSSSDPRTERNARVFKSAETISSASQEQSSDGLTRTSKIKSTYEDETTRSEVVEIREETVHRYTSESSSK